MKYPHLFCLTVFVAAATACDAQAVRSGLADVAMPPPMLPAPLSGPKLGTGHGEREYSFVNHSDFLRMQAQPNEVVRIHYDSLENLLAMGIVSRPRPAWPQADPFPGSSEQRYVPDPPG